MDGAGADGNATPRFAAYGATKRSLAQLGKSLTAELGLLVSCCTYILAIFSFRLARLLEGCATSSEEPGLLCRSRPHEGLLGRDPGRPTGPQHFPRSTVRQAVPTRRFTLPYPWASFE